MLQEAKPHQWWPANHRKRGKGHRTDSASRTQEEVNLDPGISSFQKCEPSSSVEATQFVLIHSSYGRPSRHEVRWSNPRQSKVLWKLSTKDSTATCEKEELLGGNMDHFKEAGPGWFILWSSCRVVACAAFSTGRG